MFCELCCLLTVWLGVSEPRRFEFRVSPPPLRDHLLRILIVHNSCHRGYTAWERGCQSGAFNCQWR